MTNLKKSIRFPHTKISEQVPKLHLHLRFKLCTFIVKFYHCYSEKFRFTGDLLYRNQKMIK